MPSRSRHVSEARLRATVRDAVAANSLRQIARGVGMSPSGLQKFIDGSTPHSATRRKLELWYSRHAGRVTPTAVLAGLEALVCELPPSDRGDAMREVLAAVRDEYRSRTGTVPAWVDDVVDELNH